MSYEEIHTHEYEGSNHKLTIAVVTDEFHGAPKGKPIYDVHFLEHFVPCRDDVDSEEDLKRQHFHCVTSEYFEFEGDAIKAFDIRKASLAAGPRPSGLPQYYWDRS